MGGAIYYNYNKPLIIDSIFSDNLAHYGNDFASYPARIGQKGSTVNDKITLTNIASGMTISQNLELALLDMDDQVMNLYQTSQIIILPVDSSISSASGTNVEPINNGTASFDSLSFVVDQKLREADFQPHSNSINTQKVSEVLGIINVQPQIDANFRDCQPGERILNNR